MKPKMPPAVKPAQHIILPIAVRTRPRPGGKTNPMRREMNQFQNPTARAKIVEVNRQRGVRNIGKQQGSTFIINDTLPLAQGLLAEGTTFIFFLNAKLRQFPFTNLIDGKLLVGESLAIERMYYYIISEDAATGEIMQVDSIDTFGVPGIEFGQFSMMIANSQVVKPTPILSMKPEFNRFAQYVDYNVFHFENDIVIPQLIEFQQITKVPAVTIPTSTTLNFYLGCTIEGHGAILSTGDTY